MQIENTKLEISKYIESSTLSDAVLSELIGREGVVPKETELWDYKQDFNPGKGAYLKLVKAIASFYNTHGGYVVYGVRELEKDQVFEASGIQLSALDITKLRRMVSQYCGRAIDVSYIDLEHEVGGQKRTYGLLHIPKRPLNSHSVAMTSDGHAEDGKHLFTKNSTFFRRLDECVRAETQDDFTFLMGERSLWPDLTRRSKTKFIVNNLPSRSFICPIFIGRSVILQQLWAWLGDDLESVKVLAGEGGKGKTSIAYEFATLMASSGNSEFDQVIWLTAKQKQFKARINDYIENPSLNFTDFQSFLETVCEAVGGMARNEIEEAPLDHLKRQAREALDVIPTLLVVDDVDSLTDEEQRRVLETVRAISNSGSKILVTTRANVTYSHDIAISVPGLEGDEYTEYVDQLSESFGLPTFSLKEKSKLQAASEGSPLYTESIFRLCKLGYKLSQAISDWKGEKGEDVRDAALKREIDQLTVESRKILFLLTVIGSCSIAEIRDYLDLERSQVDRCITELGSLFLLQDAPIIENEPRYEIGRSITSMIQSHGVSFLPNQVKLEREIQERAKAFEHNRRGTKREEVAKAIAQCNALIRQQNFLDAEKTIKNVLRRDRYARNPDLLLMLGKVSYFDPGATAADAKRKFSDAFHAGQRKELLFDLWFDTEKIDGSAAGAMEVCDFAILDGKHTTTLWYRRAAETRLDLSKKVSTFNRAATLLVEAHGYVSSALRYSPKRYRDGLKEMSKDIVDELWQLSEIHGEYEIAMKALDNAISAGDIRSVNYVRLAAALEKLARDPKKDIKRLKVTLNRRLDELHEQKRSELVVTIERDYGF